MLIHECLRRITKEKLRDDQEPYVFFAVKGLLENVAPITVRRQLDDAASEV